MTFAPITKVGIILLKKRTLTEAKTYLEGLKVFIRQGDYQRALQELEEQ